MCCGGGDVRVRLVLRKTIINLLVLVIFQAFPNTSVEQGGECVIGVLGHWEQGLRWRNNVCCVVGALAARGLDRNTG